MRRTELKRMSDERRDALLAQGIFPTSTLVPKRAAERPKRRADTGPDKATVALVMERDGGRCVGCGELVHGIRGVDYSIHHRKRRSQGVDNSPSNLILLDGSGTTGCHGLAHSEVAASRLSGFLLHSTENPEEVFVEHARFGRVRLLNDGTVAR